MTISDLPIPSTARPIAGQNDTGKKVIINSIGKVLVNTKGTVLYGPFIFVYRRNKEDKGVRRKGPEVITAPYWIVRLDDWTTCPVLNFVESELDFNLE